MRDINTGFYEENRPLIRNIDDKAMPIYRDCGVYITEDEIRTERQMKIKNRNIFVRSFFPCEPTFTPTDKLLQLVSLNEK